MDIVVTKDNLGDMKKNSRSECGYGENQLRLKKHQKDKFLLNLILNYPCDMYDGLANCREDGNNLPVTTALISSLS